jgi:hypothetical protein
MAKVEHKGGFHNEKDINKFGFVGFLHAMLNSTGATAIFFAPGREWS